MVTMVIVTIVICALFTVIEVVTATKNPLSGLHNLPSSIQQRVHLLPEYQDKTKKILSVKERILKKLPAILVLLLMFTGIVYMAGAKTFFQGFCYAFGMWVAVKLYVTVVLTCGWYAHTPSVWIAGTEDMVDEYKNYRFYLSSIPRSMLVGVIVSVIIGLVVMVI